MTDAIDWGAALRVGVLHLGLTPEVFWQLTPAELHMLLPGQAVQGAMQAKELAALMALYPDGGKESPALVDTKKTGQHRRTSDDGT